MSQSGSSLSVDAQEIHLQFVFPDLNAHSRTFQITRLVEGSPPAELYKFHHPNTGFNSGVTAIQRKNAATQRWENAGQIEWSSSTNATVYFGIERVPIKELRRAKVSGKSRRFKAGGAEYKWKIAENEADLFCVNSRGKKIAYWTQESLILAVAQRKEEILDRLVVTCFLNLWFKQNGLW